MINHRIKITAVFIPILAVLTTGLSGCKKTSTVEVPQNILQAKSASLEELLHIVNRSVSIHTLQARIKAEYTSEEEELDQIELEKYPKAPGHLLLRRPSTTYLVIQNPVLKKTEISFLSIRDEFRLWVHGKRTFYIGKNSASELISEDMEENPKIPIRAAHLFEALLPNSIDEDNPDIRISIIEERDENNKYYTITVYRDNGSLLLRPVRELRIERAHLTISHQRIFDDEGIILADITYDDVPPDEEYFLPGKIHLERPVDGYTLDLELTDWRTNPVVEEEVLTLVPPEGVKVIRFQ